MQPDKLTPDYWIDMGAMAITTLAGAQLLQTSSQWALLQGLTSFLTGFTLLFWVTSTWWIPLLLIVELWRHVWGRVPLAYSPDYWSLVFPLGMYSEATARLARVADFTFLHPIAVGFLYAALVVWGMTFVGMAHKMLRKLPGLDSRIRLRMRLVFTLLATPTRFRERQPPCYPRQRGQSQYQG